ncbi:hypothetical protein SteCoe_35738 [Stentor coeruleus]|uniref:Uncharacterized protein n=1 Tax=Stentor coeruleus TaxID=5963 RepID=A0A1R2ARK7_9CILI|nr:hypothetical protein SteCoe_35738 [Stentor coeruleus]
MGAICNNTCVLKTEEAVENEENFKVVPDLKRKNVEMIEEVESEYSPLPSLPLPSLSDTEPKFFFGGR